jgi:hypothetical protein
MKLTTWLFIIIAVVGIYFLGSGLTGFVISQSCCMGEACAPENLCDAAKPIIEQPLHITESFTNLLIGAGVLGLLILATLGLRKKRR